MKTANTISLCLAALVGFVLGTSFHPFSARAEAHTAERRPTVYVTSVGTGGPGISVEGRQVIGFSCINTGPNTGNCYVASVK